MYFNSCEIELSTADFIGLSKHFLHFDIHSHYNKYYGECQFII